MVIMENSSDLNPLELLNSEELDQVEFVSNSENTNMLSVITDCLETCQEFKISVAFITEGGVESIIQTLSNLNQSKIKGQIITTDYQYVSQPKALDRLAMFDNISLKMYITDNRDKGIKEGFHTKGYIFKTKEDEDEYDIVIGSSNLTSNALKINKEWNTKIVTTRKHKIAKDVLAEFNELWQSDKVHPYAEYRDWYKEKYEQLKKSWAPVSIEINKLATLQPNIMQQEFVKTLTEMTENGAKRALLISATGTGKTYASAFAIKELKSKKVLFLIHREQIAKQALRSYENVFKGQKKLALLSGNHKDVAGADIVFATMQTMSKDYEYQRFKRDEFDVIIVDEAHRVGAPSYQKILNYFQPKLYLGMSGSPDRTDDFDVYKCFDHNIACEIRLQQALEYDFLCPFHYFGITDFEVDEHDEEIKLSDFRYLCSAERVKYILDKIEFYGYSGNKVKGLIFCSRKEEGAQLSELINDMSPYKTIFLSGDDSQEKREWAIDKLESNDPHDCLDYIITVDIFNEGIDIPCVNQVVMLRPTQSPIIFVQQLGRGLRKYDDKEYVVVIDFIANYNNNYMIPIALSGDRTYNKENLRRYVHEGNRIINGASTINFDQISKKRIFDSIDSANFSQISLIKENYKSLKFKVGRIPKLSDFDDFGYMDLQCIFSNKTLRSYHNFLTKYEDDYTIELSELECRYIDFISQRLANGKRDLELLVLKTILDNKNNKLFYYVEQIVGYKLEENQKDNICNILSNNFITGSGKDGYKGVQFVEKDGSDIKPDNQFITLLKNEEFKNMVEDLVEYGLNRYKRIYAGKEDEHNLVLYEKYSYDDVCRCLNWSQSVVPLNIGGYKFDEKTKTLPIFVNYNKDENIQSSIKYDDKFLSKNIMSWVSKNKRTLDSPEIRNIIEYKERGVGLYLFVRKNNASAKSDSKLDGPGNTDTFKEFYYLGKIMPNPLSKPKPIQIYDQEKNQNLSAVNVEFKLEHPVRDDIYDYIVNK